MLSVADNTPRLLVLENQPLGPIESFCLLNLEIPGIIISSDVIFAEFPDCSGFWVIKGGYF